MKSFDNQVAVYSSDSNLEWREVEGGELPSPRNSLRASVIGYILIVIGGFDDDLNELTELTSILSWDPVAESWQQAGDLVRGRDFHAAVAVPTSLVEC